MRLIKMFGLAALAAVAATAFIGAPSASASTNTQLCKVHTGLTCPGGEGTETLHLVNEGLWKFLTTFGTVLCLNVLRSDTLLELGNPQIVHDETSYTNCGRNSAHSNCTLTVEEQRLLTLLKNGLDHGKLTAENGLLRVQCSGFPSFNCVYDTTGIEFEVGNNELVAEETPVEVLEGTFFCPESSTLDGVLTTLENTYILQ
jgi:hypothetical protein